MLKLAFSSCECLNDSVFALAAVAVVVASIEAGAVLSSYREIGIINALGFTPREVFAIVIGPMVLSALAGAIVEIPVGVGASGPTLSDVASETGLPRQDFIDPVVDVAILLGTVMLVVISALIPAIRAARTRFGTSYLTAIGAHRVAAVTAG